VAELYRLLGTMPMLRDLWIDVRGCVYCWPLVLTGSLTLGCCRRVSEEVVHSAFESPTAFPSLKLIRTNHMEEIRSGLQKAGRFVTIAPMRLQDDYLDR
jgi:hypothetical protein